MQYLVVVVQEWSERGEVIVSADSKDEAHELVEEMLSSDPDLIDWQSDSMEPGRSEIESVEPNTGEAGEDNDHDQ